MHSTALLLLAVTFTHGFGQVEFVTEKTTTHQEPEGYNEYENIRTEVPDGEVVSDVKTNGIRDTIDAVTEAFNFYTLDDNKPEDDDDDSHMRSLTTLIKQIITQANDLDVTENLTTNTERKTNQTSFTSTTTSSTNAFVVSTSVKENNEDLKWNEKTFEIDQTTNMFREEKTITDFGQTIPSEEFVTVEKEMSGEKQMAFKEQTQDMYDASSAFVATENFTSSEEDSEQTEDLVEKQINDAINSMPKLPELILSDNKTHFKFRKDSEEMFMDEKITEIAKELAEKSLRKQYEEQKLSHLTAKMSKMTKQYLNTEEKPIKLKKIKLPALKPGSVSERKFGFSKTSYQVQKHKPEDNTKLTWPLKEETRNPTATETPQTTDPDFFEKVTNLPQILKVNKTENQIKEMNGMLRTKHKPSPTESDKLITPIPITFYDRKNKLETTEKSSLLISLLDKGKPEAFHGTNNNTFYSHI